MARSGSNDTNAAVNTKPQQFREGSSPDGLYSGVLLREKETNGAYIPESQKNFKKQR